MHAMHRQGLPGHEATGIHYTQLMLLRPCGSAAVGVIPPCWVQGQKVHGNNWAAIAQLLPGRKSNNIKALWRRELQSPNADRVKDNK